VLNNLETYGFKAWHGTLLTIAVIIFVSLFNTVLAARLPFVEGVLLILHMAGLFAIIIPLWVSTRYLAWRSSAHSGCRSWLLVAR
jgi:choline transport protein